MLLHYAAMLNLKEPELPCCSICACKC